MKMSLSLFAVVSLLMAVPGWAAAAPDAKAVDNRLVELEGGGLMPLAEFLASLAPAPARGPASLDELDPLAGAAPATCGSDWCSWEDDWRCYQTCVPCNYQLVCNASNCTDYCQCIFTNCPP